jgi:2-polyprenyl-3-methyl-5-hydroxy-6-metoxy-1,4-benzoquinol methylase
MISENIELPSTGERLTGSTTDEQTILEHLQRYWFARNFSAGKNVLDIACGEGYGCSILGSNANTVIGVDISPEVIEFARRKYGSNQVSFECGSALKIPLDDDSVDLVVSFETIEHVDHPEVFLDEIRRVLRHDGILIVSTPEKSTYSDGRHVNHFHISEMYEEEFYQLLSSRFTSVQKLQQKFVVGTILTAEASQVDIVSLSYSSCEKRSLIPLYHIAIAGNQEINEFSGSFAESNVTYDEYKHCKYIVDQTKSRSLLTNLIGAVEFWARCKRKIGNLLSRLIGKRR